MMVRRWPVCRAILAGVAAVGAFDPPVLKAAPTDDTELAELDSKTPGELVNDPRALLELVQNGATAKTKTVKSSDIPGGGAALQVRLDTVPDQPWRISANMTLRGSIARGDVVTVGFHARALPDKDGNASGRIGVRIQQNVSPWSGYLDRTIEVGPEWQWYEAAGAATIATQGGASVVTLSLGAKAQNLEIGQIIVVKGANAIAAEVKPVIELPPAIANIPGKLVNRPDAGPWNFFGTGGSQQRIDDKTIFMGKASRVTVTDATGKPWELASLIPMDGPIKTGDRFLVAIAVKTVTAATADGKGVVGIRFQSNKPPYSGFSDNSFQPATKWQLIQLRSTATMDVADGEAAFSLLFGGTQQVIDVGPVYILKLD